MYIDKLYTRLYSDHNWSGLDQLIQEIRVFAGRQDYEGRNFIDRVKLRQEKNRMADYANSKRSDLSGKYASGQDSVNNPMFFDRMINRFKRNRDYNNLSDEISDYVDYSKRNLDGPDYMNDPFTYGTSQTRNRENEQNLPKSSLLKAAGQEALATVNDKRKEVEGNIKDVVNNGKLKSGLNEVAELGDKKIREVANKAKDKWTEFRNRFNKK